MRIRAVISSLLVVVAPFSADAAGALRFPAGSSQGYEEVLSETTAHIPVGPFVNGGIDTRTADGVVTRRVWKTPPNMTNTQVLLAALRQQLKEGGYSVLFECETRDCGGFDFRFETDVIDEPDMHVDLGDFRYLSAARKQGDDEEFVGLLVSRSPEHGFIQVTRAGLDPELAGTGSLSSKSPEPEVSADTGTEVIAATDLDIASSFATTGSAVLEGVTFRMGSAELDGNPAKSLTELALFLRANPEKSVILVGHTDASGSLSGNVALSRKRAESVLRQLTSDYGVNTGQLAAEGVGYLAPRATNTTQEGRNRNRRVEAILTTLD